MPGIPGTMKEFYGGTLKSSNGAPVKSRAQALAIGYSEEGEKRTKKKPKRYSRLKKAIEGLDEE